MTLLGCKGYDDVMGSLSGVRHVVWCPAAALASMMPVRYDGEVRGFVVMGYITG